MTTPIDELAGLRVAFAKAEDDRPENADGGDFGRGYRAAWNHARGIVLAALGAARSTPVPASNVSEGLREALNGKRFDIGGYDGDEFFPAPGTGSYVLWEDIDAALAHAAPERLDMAALKTLDALEAMAEHAGKGESWPDLIDSVRYVIRTDGLDVLLARLSQPDATEEAGRCPKCGRTYTYGLMHDCPDATEEAGPRNDRASTFDRYAEPRDA